MGLLKTAIVVADAFVTNFGFVKGGRMALHGAGQLIRALFTKESQLSMDRTVACMNCRMYNSKYETCGTPSETYVETVVKKTIEFKELKPLGCHCYLPLANRLKDKDCWARFHGLSFGWPDQLRPK